MLLIYVLNYRLDLIALAAISLGAVWLCQKFVASRRPPSSLRKIDLAMVAVVLLGGAIAAEWAGENRKASLIAAFSGYVRTYAHEMHHLNHRKIQANTAPDDPTYITLIERETEWLKLNPYVADIYTFRGDEKGNIYLIVDSETDYNHNGIIDGDKEQRIPIGEPYENPNENFQRALKGETVFDMDFTPDRWGVWVSCFAPIYNDRDEIEAAVGLDFPAAQWMEAIAANRGAAIGIAALIIAILLSRATVVSLLRSQVIAHTRNEEMLCEAQRNGDAANQAKNEFLAVMSHEIRTPLTAILGFSSLLSKSNLAEAQKLHVDAITKAGERLATLIDDILDISRMEDGRVLLKRAPYTPVILIHALVDLLETQARAHNLSLVLDNKLPDNLTLLGDQPRIRQVLVNLLDNAIKFTEQGTITIKMEWNTSGQTTTSGELAIQIIDTGPGIPADKIANIFDLFMQIDSSSTRRHGGVGLGLAICKRLADLMGGRLTVHSERGKGSVFCFYLPAETAQTNGHKNSTAQIPINENASRGRALVVDDQTLNRELLKLMLKKLSFEPDLAASGQAALELIAHNNYTVILMDLDMPVLDGFGTTKKIRERERIGHQIPIIAVTATTRGGTRERCLAVGMDEYMAKPVFLPALQAIIDTVVPPPAAKA
ncbi:MAG: response regulator [Verrucomicrobia bacterium]|nr:response regulator [Verrucomicrobiota bacterium]